MGSLQPAIPLPSLLPNRWSILMIYLKDCFSTTPSQENDKDKLSFTVTTYNNSQPANRFHWKILPQGILNSPILGHYFIQQSLELICKLFPQSIIYHYMDDILLVDSNRDASGKKI